MNIIKQYSSIIDNDLTNNMGICLSAELSENIFDLLKDSLADLSKGILINSPHSQIIDSVEFSFEDYSAYMEFWGDITGQIYLTINRPAVEIIAEQMFGLDITSLENDEYYIEGVKEVLNILVGNNKNILKHDGINFENSLPESIDSESAEMNLSFAPHHTSKIKIEDYELAVVLTYM